MFQFSSTCLISETEKYVWLANVNENGFPSMLVFLIRDVNISSPPGPSATLRRNSKLKQKEWYMILERNIIWTIQAMK